jgi:hypothetical protein
MLVSINKTLDTLLEMVDRLVWIPAFAGMTGWPKYHSSFLTTVIPAKAGIQFLI